MIRLRLNSDWVEDCMKWRKEVLHGVFCHWCWDWDGLPVDETTMEWPCVCFSSFWSRLKWRFEEWRSNR